MEVVLHSILGTWEDARIEADEYSELDDKRVLAFNHLSGRGKASGLDVSPMQRNGAALLFVSGGKVTKYVSYNDRQRALVDLDLRE